ncbi:transposase [Streptomyces cellulosae]
MGLACSMRDWFTAAQRLLPDELTDEAWARVEPIVKAWEPLSHRCRPGRVMLNAMLFYKARTGCLWEELPERFGLWKGIHSRYKTWRNCGVWDEIMAALPDEGQPVWTPPLVPPLRVEGRVDPRGFTGAEEEAVSGETGVPAPVTRSGPPPRCGQSCLPQCLKGLGGAPRAMGGISRSSEAGSGGGWAQRPRPFSGPGVPTRRGVGPGASVQHRRLHSRTVGHLAPVVSAAAPTRAAPAARLPAAAGAGRGGLCPGCGCP